MPSTEKEIKLSDETTVSLKVVNMLEQMTADTFAAALAAKQNVAATGDLRIKASAICSIRKRNGGDVQPLANFTEFMSVASDIGGIESYALVDAYITEAGLGVEKPKGNETTAAA